MVPVGDGGFTVIGGKVLLQPVVLSVADRAAADLRAVGVEGDEMPRPQVVGVVGPPVGGSREAKYVLKPTASGVSYSWLPSAG